MLGPWYRFPFRNELETIGTVSMTRQQVPEIGTFCLYIKLLTLTIFDVKTGIPFFLTPRSNINGVTFVFQQKKAGFQDLLPGLRDRAHRLQLVPKWKIDTKHGLCGQLFNHLPCAWV
eukprot:SAG11_NODE_2816_length_2943_cov_7.547117_4_plen_116_part_01